MKSGKFMPIHFKEIPTAEMKQRAAEFAAEMGKRRSVRQFSEKDVPEEIIWNCIKTANSAPSGANRQPWHFVIVKNQELKRKIRESAEGVEKKFYQSKATREHVAAVNHLGTNWRKAFLEQAPYLIALFVERFRLLPNQEKEKNYFMMESVGLAGGLLLAAIHHAGLTCLTYTPTPSDFLRNLLGRPANERLFMLFVVGYPGKDAVVPELTKKSAEAVTSVFE